MERPPSSGASGFPPSIPRPPPPGQAPRKLPPPKLLAQPQIPDSTILYQTGARVVELSDSIVMKSGRGIQMEESEALILAGQLELPVPHVYEAQPIANGGASISMDYVPGESLKTIWPTMTPEQKEDIAVQLRDILDKMRALPSETNSIQACGGGVVRDCRSYGSYTGGPFPDEEAFNTFILDFPPTTPKAISAGLATRLRCDHGVVFTHGDLSQHNILVQDNTIVGLIDWEFAGWFPEYWEYIKFFERPTPHRDWFDYADIIFSQSYVDELIDYQAISHWHRS